MIKDRWNAARRTRSKFEDTSAEWLTTEECFPEGPCSGGGGNASSTGRPALPFHEKGRRAKLKSTAGLRRASSREELVFSAASKVYEAGQRDAAKHLEAVGSPRRGPSLMAQVKIVLIRRG